MGAINFGSIILLFLSINCFAQTERVFTVKKKSKAQAAPQADTSTAGSSRINASGITYNTGVPAKTGNFTVSSDSLVKLLNLLLRNITPNSFRPQNLQVAMAMFIDCQGNKTYYTSTQLKLSDDALKAISTIQKGCTFSVQDVRFYDNTVSSNDMHFGPYNFTLK